MNKTKTKSKAKKTGRPRGSKTRSQVVEANPSRCSKCDSTNRSPYIGTATVREYDGLDVNGKPFNRVVWRRCRCKDCGQLRQDRAVEFSPSLSA